MVLVILLLVLVGLAASYTLSRVASAGDERDDTRKRLATAAAALERFAAANGYLPCPANPALATGLADPSSAKKCAHGDDGTLPWATLGLNSDAGLDGWGRKITYRVYTGGATGKGSLTQPRGVDMVQCDITDPDGATDADGLCVANANPHLRSTTQAEFFNGKGLSVTDYGVAHADTAYVLVSHGSTGLAAWTIAGTQLDMPAGDERNNARETGPFTIRAASDPDTSATAGTHFDDLLAYATLPDLVKRIGLEAREWPELAAPANAAVTLTKANVEAATGTAVNSTTGDTSRSSIDFSSLRISGFTGTDSATNVSYDPNTAGSGNGGIGVVGGSSALMSSGAGEWLRVDLARPARVFAVTFDHFGTYTAVGVTYTEKVELRFYDGTFAVGTVTVSACSADGGLASFSNVDPGGFFDAVNIVPVSAAGSPSGSSDSALLVADLSACDTTSGNCRTSLWAAGNKCN
jgi:type II secretory pathway pseudopilin PulG